MKGMNETKSKFTINTKDGLKKVPAIPFRFRSPKWLSSIRFITHPTQNEMVEPGFTVSDIKTGRSISAGYDTRQEAKVAAHEKIITAGRVEFFKRRKMFTLKSNSDSSR